MTNSTIVPLVKYTSVLNQVWFFTEEEAKKKLEFEMFLYEQWKNLDYLKGEIVKPSITYAPYNKAT